MKIYQQQQKLSKQTNVIIDTLCQTSKVEADKPKYNRKSQLLKSYQKIMNFSQTKLDFSVLQLEKYGVQYQKNSNYEQFSFTVEKLMDCWEILQITVKIAKFRLSLLLLNIQGMSPFSNTLQSASGSFGKIYFSQFLSENIAIKSFKFSNNKNQAQILSSAIKQFCIFKICSIMKCAPPLVPNLGFDFILFDNQIHFAVAQCNQVNDLTDSDGLQLIQKLGLLHSFNIIHFDIKPQNICCCSKTKSLFFIDFGLSEIIKEQIGFKSYVNFKGSPAFCSQEMLRLFTTGNIYNFVDLYYNDLHSLKSTIRLLKNVSNQMVFQDINQAGLFQENCYSDLFLLSSFKYHVLVEDYKMVQKLLAQYTHFIQYGREILLFLKQLPTCSFIEKIFIQELKVLKFIRQYEEMKTHLNFYSEKIQRNISSFKREEQYRNEKDFKKRFQGIQNTKLSPNQMQGKNYEKYQQFLNKIEYKPESEGNQKYLDILIECLRFDMKNIKIKVKQKLAKQFNKSVGLKHNQNTQQYLNIIGLTFEYLLDYCLKSPSSNWKKQKIFVLILQSLLIDLDLQTRLHSIVLFLNRQYESCIEKLKLSLQILNIVHLWKFKYISRHYQSDTTVYMSLQQLRETKFKQVIELGSKNQEPEIQQFIKPYQYLIQESKRIKFSIENFFELIKQFNCIKDDKIRKQVKSMLFYEFIDTGLIIGLDQLSLNNYKNILKQINGQYLTSTEQRLDFTIFFRYHYCLSRSNFKEISKLSHQISQLIDCQQIFDKFQFGLNTFLIDSDCNPQLLRKYLGELNTFLLVNGLDRKLFNEIFGMLGKIISNNVVNFQTWKFITILQKYILQCDFTNSQNLSQFQQKYFILQRHQFLEYLLLIDSDFLSRNQNKFKAFQQKCQAISSINKTNHFNEYLVLLAIYFQNRQQNDKAVKYFERLKLATKNILEMRKIMYFACNHLIILNHKLNNFYSQSAEVLYFYQIDSSPESLIRYFSLSSTSIIAITLMNFSRNKNSVKLFQFLQKIGEFILIYPIFCYFLNLINQSQIFLESVKRNNPKFDAMSFISNFSKINWKNRYCIAYYILALDLITKDSQKWIVLHKISQIVDELAVQIKNYILQIYCFHFMELLKQNKRKAKYIQLKLAMNYNSTSRISSSKLVKQNQANKKCLNQKYQMLQLKIKRKNY